MSNECPHIWMLDHEEYFLNIGRHINYQANIIFIAKCLCGEKRTFTKEQWLEHIGERK